jgi:tRNA G18 (ribose-2'-O)-methylase SpoU
VKSFSQSKFLQLPAERQARVVLDGLYQVDHDWPDKPLRHAGLQQVKTYWQWMTRSEQTDWALRRLQALSDLLHTDLTRRQLLDLTVPLERVLDLALKDDQVVPVREGDLASARETHPIFFILDHLRSSFNVGSLFRTAECLGVEHIYLVGYTPTPHEAGVSKTAMGTSDWVSWSTHDHLSEVFQLLKDKGVPVVALETAEMGESLFQWQAPAKMAWLVGNERFGLQQKALQAVDHVVAIPLCGQKNSLNVGTALSMATYEVLRQWKQ